MAEAPLSISYVSIPNIVVFLFFNSNVLFPAIFFTKIKQAFHERHAAEAPVALQRLEQVQERCRGYFGVRFRLYSPHDSTVPTVDSNASVEVLTGISKQKR